MNEGEGGRSQLVTPETWVVWHMCPILDQFWDVFYLSFSVCNAVQISVQRSTREVKSYCITDNKSSANLCIWGQFGTRG